jgi:hypothetical protein
MKLVEAESEGPVEGDDAIVTPPRPPHRRVSVSLLFTLLVLTGTVVSIYTVFPARDNVLLTEAVDEHRSPPAWDLTAPSPPELRAWAIGVVGKDAPLPSSGEVLGAKRVEIHDRPAALLRFKIGPDDVTYLVQHASGISPDHSERTDGDVFAMEWVSGRFTCIAVGPAATRDRWAAALGQAPNH